MLGLGWILRALAGFMASLEHEKEKAKAKKEEEDPIYSDEEDEDEDEYEEDEEDIEEDDLDAVASDALNLEDEEPKKPVEKREKGIDKSAFIKYELFKMWLGQPDYLEMGVSIATNISVVHAKNEGLGNKNGLYKTWQYGQYLNREQNETNAFKYFLEAYSHRINKQIAKHIKESGNKVYKSKGDILVLYKTEQSLEGLWARTLLTTDDNIKKVRAKLQEKLAKDNLELTDSDIRNHLLEMAEDDIE